MIQHVSARQQKSGQWRALTVMLVLLVVSALRWPPQETYAGEPARATTRAVDGVKEVPSLALLDVLDGVWPHRTRKEWDTSVLASMEDLSAVKPPNALLLWFNIKERDRMLANLGAAFLKISPNAKSRCLILEHIDEYPGATHRYRRLIVFCAEGLDRQASEDLRKHNAIELKEDTWTKMETWIKASVSTGGGTHGLKRAYGTDDTTVISFYDGRRWHVAAWMSFERYLHELQNPPGVGKPYPKYPVPSAEVIAFGNLLNFLDAIPEVPERFAPVRYDYLKQYIEFLPQNPDGKKQ